MLEVQDMKAEVMETFYQNGINEVIRDVRMWQHKSQVQKQNYTEQGSGKVTNRKHLCELHVTTSLWEEH